MLTDNQKNIATFIHLSTFSRFIIPLGNFIGPIVLWSINKDKSEFYRSSMVNKPSIFKLVFYFML